MHHALDVIVQRSGRDPGHIITICFIDVSCKILSLPVVGAAQVAVDVKLPASDVIVIFLVHRYTLCAESTNVSILIVVDETKIICHLLYVSLR